MKHFVGYPNPRSGHDRSPEWIPDRQLYQYYTPAFYAAIKAGVATAMESVPPCYLASSPSPLSLFDVRVVSPVSRLPGSSRSSGGNQLGHLKVPVGFLSLPVGAYGEMRPAHCQSRRRCVYALG
jgi:hypothetical protein